MRGRVAATPEALPCQYCCHPNRLQWAAPKPPAPASVKRSPRFDWLGLWAISLGLCALVLAGIADVVGDDNIGAAFILIGAAAVIALIVCADGEADEQT